MTAESFKYDFQTPVPVAKYMVSLLPEWGVNTVLEPTPGVGNIVKALFERGFKVVAPEDYFLLETMRFDAVVMNPPFSHKFTILNNAPIEIHKAGMRMGYWFLVECMKRSDIVIALMPWFTISDSDVRLRALKDFGLVSVTALPRKTFQFARIQTCVLHLQKGYRGATEFKVYDRLIKSIQIEIE
jgi:hypothetical protein